METISHYGTQQAIEDGDLVQPIEAERRFLVTNEVYASLEAIAGKRGVAVSTVAWPLLMDAAMIVRRGVQRDPDEYLWTKGLEGNATGERVWIARNEVGGITLMFPREY